MRKILLLTPGLICLALALSTLTFTAHAQYGTLSIGTFNNGSSETCPGSGWYFYIDSNNLKHYVNCYAATVSGCANANTLGLSYGYLDPVGLVPGITKELGVIVIHSGQDGRSPGGDDVGISDGDWKFADY
jgi:hypothetical protein